MWVRRLTPWSLLIMAAASVLIHVHWAPGPGTFVQHTPEPRAASEELAPRAPSASWALLHNNDLARGIRATTNLPKELAHALRNEVDSACRVPVLLRLDGRDDPDPRRDWARQALTQRCAGLPEPSLYVRRSETLVPSSDDDSASDPEKVLSELAAAIDSPALKIAWMQAWRADALPQEQIFSDGRRLLEDEAENLIAAVADWRECARHHACGDSSLITLRVCALHGCEPGSDVWAAYHDALSPRDFEAARAIHGWLQSLPTARQLP